MLQKEYNQLIDKFYGDVEALNLTKPVVGIATKMGVSKGNVSSILNKKLQPSEQFIKKFYESFSQELSSHNGNSNQASQEPQATNNNYAPSEVDYRKKYEALLEKTNHEQSATIAGVLNRIDANLRDAAFDQHVFRIMTAERQRVALENIALLRGLTRHELVHEADSTGAALLDEYEKKHTVVSDTIGK